MQKRWTTDGSLMAGRRMLAAPFCLLSLIACGAQAPADDEYSSIQEGFGGLSGVFWTVSADTQIVEADSTNYGSRDRISVRGDGPGSALTMVGLIKWSPPPDGGACTVNWATITLGVLSPSSDSFNLYPANRTWAADQANWSQATTTNAWEIAGAMGHTDRGPAFQGFTPSVAGPLTIPLNSAGIGLVQSWVNDPATNKGIMLWHPTHSNGFSIGSSENSTPLNHPRLQVKCQ